MPDELSMQDLLDIYNSPEQVKEATSRPTVPGGIYILTTKKATFRYAGEQSPWPGRKMVSWQVQYEKEGETKGSGFVDLAFDPDENNRYRTSSGRLDRPALLWGQVVAALGAENKGVVETIEMLPHYSLEANVQELFNTGFSEDGQPQWKQAKSADERKLFFSQGCRAINTVTSVRRVK